MSPQTETLFDAARELPEAEQVELISALIASLDEIDPQPLDPSWMEEIKRRSAEYDRGEVTPIPWSEVQARLLARKSNRG